MTALQNYKECSTSGIRALDLQLIAQIRLLAPGALVRFDHLNVKMGAGCHPYLQSAAVKALEQALLKSKPGATLFVNSAYRTLAQQYVLWNHCQCRRCGIRAAAKPGQSNHETALALDINEAQLWRPHLEKFNWDWLGSFDPMHFDYRGVETKKLKRLSVLAFQKLWNLNSKKIQLIEDGIFGDATLRALSWAPVEGFRVVPKSQDIPQTVSAMTHQTSLSKFPPLRQGAIGDEVKQLQRALKNRGYSVVEDGIFGEATLASVKKCQLEAGLVPDGAVGMATSKVLGLP